MAAQGIDGTKTCGQSAYHSPLISHATGTIGWAVAAVGSKGDDCNPRDVLEG